MNMHVEVLGLPQLTARLGKISDWANKGIEDTMQEAVRVVYEQIPPDPPASGRSMLPFIKSEKQRRWLMWAINSGAITVPYPRTGDLRGSLKMEVRSLGGQWVGSVGSSSPVAPWVISDTRVGNAGPQARYHHGTWWTLQAEMRKATRNIIGVFAKALARVVNGN